MAVYRFQVSYPVHSLLPRDRFTNTFHMEKVAGAALGTDLDSICDDICTMFGTRLGAATREVACKAYDVPHVQPNPPRSSRVKNLGVLWTPLSYTEGALCLSFAANASLPRERGRMYLPIGIARNASIDTAFGTRPTTPQMQWALDFYSVANASLPDLGGIDWKFGVWSPSNNSFKQTTKAWVDNEWDTVRSRGLRESARLTSVRDG